LARQLVRDGVVPSISSETVRRILEHHRLKPWRHHLWLSPKVPRDAAFAAAVQAICDLYTRPLAPHERVLCVDEKTSLQPRTRLSPTRPAQPGLPVRVEHEYQRKGALNLFAAFDTRSGKVYGHATAPWWRFTPRDLQPPQDSGPGQLAIQHPRLPAGCNDLPEDWPTCDEEPEGIIYSLWEPAPDGIDAGCAALRALTTSGTLLWELHIGDRYCGPAHSGHGHPPCTHTYVNGVNEFWSDPASTIDPADCRPYVYVGGMRTDSTCDCQSASEAVLYKIDGITSQIVADYVVPFGDCGPDFVFGQPVIDFVNDRVYSVASDGTMFAFDLDLNLQWSRSENFFDLPIVNRDPLFNPNGKGLVYCFGTNSSLWCLEGLNGNDVWTTGAMYPALGAIDSDGFIYNAGSCIDWFTGNVIWSVGQQYPIGNTPSWWSRPAIGIDGNLYILGVSDCEPANLNFPMLFAIEDLGPGVNCGGWGGGGP
jgi:hypothetical protein